MQLLERLQGPAEPLKNRDGDARVDHDGSGRDRRQQRRDAPTATFAAVLLHHGQHFCPIAPIALCHQEVGDILLVVLYRHHETSDTAGTTAAGNDMRARKPIPDFEEPLRLSGEIVARVVLHGLTSEMESNRTAGLVPGGTGRVASGQAARFRLDPDGCTFENPGRGDARCARPVPAECSVAMEGGASGDTHAAPPPGRQSKHGRDNSNNCRPSHPRTNTPDEPVGVIRAEQRTRPSLSAVHSGPINPVRRRALLRPQAPRPCVLPAAA